MVVYTPGNRGTIRSTADYNVGQACIKLYEAMKGLGTDEDVIIDVISSHTNQERQWIKKKYRIRYGKDLCKELDSEVSFSFGKLVLGLMAPLDEFVLETIHRSINGGQSRSVKLFKRFSSFFKEGIGGNEYLLIGLLCARPIPEIKEIKRLYKRRYGNTLEESLAIDGNNMPHDVCSFILDMVSEEREDDEKVTEVNMELLTSDCGDLIEAKNEDVLHELLQVRSFKHLKRLFDECLTLCGKSIDGIIDDLEDVISVELQQAYRAMVTLLRDGEPRFYAERVKEALEGAGTDNETLINVLVLRAEVDLVDVMEMYEELYKSDMVSDVADDTSGDYKELLLRILAKPSTMLTAPRRHNSDGEVLSESVHSSESHDVTADPEEESPAAVDGMVNESEEVEELEMDEVPEKEQVPEAEPQVEEPEEVTNTDNGEEQVGEPELVNGEGNGNTEPPQEETLDLTVNGKYSGVEGIVQTKTQVSRKRKEKTQK